MFVCSIETAYCFAAAFDLYSSCPEQLPQCLQVGGMLGQGFVQRNPQQLPVGERGLIAQPLAVALSVGLGVLHDGQAVFHTDGVAEPPDGAGTVPEVAKLPAAAQIYSAPNDMIVDVGFVNVGADDKGVAALGKALGKLHPQPVGLLRGDLAGLEGLPHLIGQHIVPATAAPGGEQVLLLGQHELGVGHAAVTAEAGDQPPAVGLLRVCRVVQDIRNGTALRAPLAHVQGHNSCGCQRIPPEIRFHNQLIGFLPLSFNMLPVSASIFFSLIIDPGVYNSDLPFSFFITCM